MSFSVATAQLTQASLFHIDDAESWIERPELSTALLRQPNDAPLYYILLSYQDRVATDRIDHYIRYAYQINDESKIEDQAQSLHNLSPESESITFHRCVIHRAGKTIDCLNPERMRTLQRDTGLENHCVSDKITIEFLIDDLRVGDVVDMDFTQTEYASAHMLKGKIYLSSARLSWGIPIKEMQHRYVNESNQTIVLQHLDTDNNINKVWELPVGESYVHQATDIESTQSTDNLPYWYWPDYLLATTKSSWEEVSAYIYEQNANQNILDIKINASLMDEIHGIDWQQTNTETITAIVRFVQENIRYRAESNGIHTHTPKSVTETLQRRTGDCKDKSALLVVLLKYIGIDASLALVSTSMRDDIKTLQASAYWFDHMVVHFTFNDHSYVIDPTLQKQGGDIDTQARLNFGLCLPITEQGSQLVSVDYDNDVLLRDENVEIDLRFKKLNECTVRIERTYFHERANHIRYQTASNEMSALENHFLEVAQDFVHLELSIIEPYRIDSDDKNKNQLKTVEFYQIEGDIDSIEDKSLYFTSYAHTDFIMPKRNTHPVATTAAGKMSFRVEVLYGNSPGSVSDDYELNNDWFEYRDTLEDYDASIVCTTDFNALTESIPAKDIAQCRAAVKTLQERSRTHVPLKLYLEETNTTVADHSWYMYPVAYWLMVQVTKILELWDNPVVIAGLVMMPVAYLVHLAYKRGWIAI